MTRPLTWQFATVKSIRADTPRVKSFTLATPWLREFRPGQHVDVRLTAPDGYQAQRSYSIASAPERASEVELTVELLADGEVSPYFHEVVQVGDEFEVRGPIGGPFTWTSRDGGPLLLLGGGSGIVPLMSMVRHRRASGAGAQALMLYSSRTFDDVIYRDELHTMSQAGDGFELLLTLTRGAPAGWTGLTGRVSAPMVASALKKLGPPSHAFVCGSNGFVESASTALIEAGVEPEIIVTERFGPTGT